MISYQSEGRYPQIDTYPPGEPVSTLYGLCVYGLCVYGSRENLAV